jgi:hypothetical protein
VVLAGKGDHPTIMRNIYLLSILLIIAGAGCGSPPVVAHPSPLVRHAATNGEQAAIDAIKANPKIPADRKALIVGQITRDQQMMQIRQNGN